MKRIVFTMAAGLMLYAASGCAQARFNLRWKNKHAPDFGLAALDGGKVQLREYRGNPVLLSFWGYGCPECHAEAPHLRHLAEIHKKDGLVVLVVNAWDDDRDVVRGFARQFRLKQRMLLNGSAVARTYRVESVPTTLWINRKGVIIDTELGFRGADDLNERTTRLLSDGP